VPSRIEVQRLLCQCPAGIQCGVLGVETLELVLIELGKQVPVDCAERELACRCFRVSKPEGPRLFEGLPSDAIVAEVPMQMSSSDSASRTRRTSSATSAPCRPR
jgi:hypothetical protein